LTAERLDFTSSLYLGMAHPSTSLRPWARLTAGAPAALTAPAAAPRVAGAFARLQGCQAATLARSTLHAYWDLVPACAAPGTAIYVDSGAYPISRWGVERAALRGVPIRAFPHLDADALRSRIDDDWSAGLRPLVVSDGVCAGCGRATPVRAYLDAARRGGGLLLLDDTQALGILGRDAGPDAPFGLGGGGSLRHSNIVSPDVVLVASMAKGLGVPMTVIAGDRNLIRELNERGETRSHCSPPSIADVYAAEHALAVNLERGDSLRLRLARNVESFREAVRPFVPGWLRAVTGIFPVQTIALPASRAQQVYQSLRQRGIVAVLHRATCRRQSAISFVITAGHGQGDIERAGAALGESLRDCW
jgi:8-amino-7-oxononanoate synthase